jgi:hypothetical protein
VASAYPDITSGSQVTVTSPSGAVIGIGTLAYDKVMSDTEAAIAGTEMGLGTSSDLLQADIAVYTFTVTGLPGGDAGFGFSAGSGHGTIWESPSQVKDPQRPETHRGPCPARPDAVVLPRSHDGLVPALLSPASLR